MHYIGGFDDIEPEKQPDRDRKRGMQLAQSIALSRMPFVMRLKTSRSATTSIRTPTGQS